MIKRLDKFKWILIATFMGIGTLVVGSSLLQTDKEITISKEELINSSEYRILDKEGAKILFTDVKGADDLFLHDITTEKANIIVKSSHKNYALNAEIEGEYIVYGESLEVDNKTDMLKDKKNGITNTIYCGKILEDGSIERKAMVTGDDISSFSEFAIKDENLVIIENTKGGKSSFKYYNLKDGTGFGDIGTVDNLMPDVSDKYITYNSEFETTHVLDIELATKNKEPKWESILEVPNLIRPKIYKDYLCGIIEGEGVVSINIKTGERNVAVLDDGNLGLDTKFEIINGILIVKPREINVISDKGYAINLEENNVIMIPRNITIKDIFSDSILIEVEKDGEVKKQIVDI
ncbi:hypothetical protein [uncultured Clostridium sp.]|uniref:hypothetical protein n=1 Tax=uncultured Clostridium sp. TaxID=59620 RepID=UPI00262E24FC|nr:hypothetical protein [uncultured Clostridium sp.]